MNPAKETLWNTIKVLSDRETRQVLEFTRRLRGKSGGSRTLQRLASDAAFSIPTEVSEGFPAVTPIAGKGVTASQLLVKDRR